MNKKGQVGLETVKAVMLAFLIIGVLAIAAVLALSSVRDAADRIDITTGQINQTLVLADGSAGNSTTVAGLRGVGLSKVYVNNATSGATVPSTNYTISKGYIYAVEGGVFNNSLIRIMADYSYPTPNSNNVMQNITVGIAGFFANTGTIFSILVVVVIILAITIIIYAVSRFGGSSSPGI